MLTQRDYTTAGVMAKGSWPVRLERLIMEIIDCIQGSEEWLLARLGKVTASRFKDVLSKGEGKTRKTYMKQLRAEILTGKPLRNSFSNKAMEWGSETEVAAKQAYANETGCEVVQVGFVVMSEWVGGSPDGLVGDQGVIEIKCPNTVTHLDYIDKDTVPTGYYAQMQGILWITGRQWCDFVSYDPEVKCRPFFCKRSKRDETYIKALALVVKKFVKELEEMIGLIRKDF